MDSSYKEIYGKNIKKLREKAKLTQAEVAKKADINVNYFAVIERGEVTTSPDNLLRISKALGVDISEIMKTK
ncbi:MAG: helix-turn-helix transcriptional regulator [Candidatus Levybacteria bacterium]|nr:helix-turn-helix transcriptional regulator [Candidatus Levybacteria bacterium]